MTTPPSEKFDAYPREIIAQMDAYLKRTYTERDEAHDKILDMEWELQQARAGNRVLYRDIEPLLAQVDILQTQVNSLREAIKALTKTCNT